MSYILHGLLLPDCIEDAIERLRESKCISELLNISHELTRLDEESSIIVNRGRLPHEIPQQAIAEALLIYKTILQVTWDDQLGVRSSTLFDGRSRRSFTANDELYVELDENGLPLQNGPRFTMREIDTLDNEREFETLENAIELGCIASGKFDPLALMSFIRRQG